jgi:hypothetical protein
MTPIHFRTPTPILISGDVYVRPSMVLIRWERQQRDAMIDIKELRRNAQDCLQQVRTATTARDKILLLNMAYAWLKLGEQVEQLRARPRIGSASAG